MNQTDSSQVTRLKTDLGRELPASAAMPVDQLQLAHRRTRPLWWGLAAILAGLSITAVLVAFSWNRFDQDENRLLSVRVREAGLLVSSALTSIQTPLVSAAELVQVSHGNVGQFKAFASDYTGPGKPFVSMSLWTLQPEQAIAVEGSAPYLASQPASVTHTFEAAASSSLLGVTGVLGGNQPRLGYAYVSPNVSPRYVIYAESQLPHDRHTAIASSSVFSDFNYALFLGKTERPPDLLTTNVSHLPVAGRRYDTVVPLGDSHLTLEMAPTVILSGSLSANYRWIVAIVGLILSLLVGILAERLLRQRARAEDLAENLDRVARDNERLYAQQRHVAETLQHALLPSELSELQGAAVAARYLPGVQGLQIGGDWYDVITHDEHQVLLVVGDVSGKGLDAATTMASLRFAIRAYAAQRDTPAEILTKLSTLMAAEGADGFATVLCLRIDLVNRHMELASAGHLPPLLMHGTDGSFVFSDVGVPVGVESDRPYRSTFVDLPTKGTILAFTDGLVERRGESLDTSLARLKSAAVAHHALALDALLSSLIDELVTERADDTAIVGMQWPVRALES